MLWSVSLVWLYSWRSSCGCETLNDSSVLFQVVLLFRVNTVLNLWLCKGTFRGSKRVELCGRRLWDAVLYHPNQTYLHLKKQTKWAFTERFHTFKSQMKLNAFFTLLQYECVCVSVIATVFTNWEMRPNLFDAVKWCWTRSVCLDESVWNIKTQSLHEALFQDWCKQPRPGMNII